MIFSNKESRNVWELHYRDYIRQTDYLPEGGLSVVRWSKDGKYAYFKSYSGGDGGECFVTGYDSGLGLFRFDLQTGDTTTILSPGDNFVWYKFSISPTDRRLVYGVHARDYQILDIATGEIIPVGTVSNFDQSGGFMWSTDGLAFVYSTINDERNETTVRLVDAQSGIEKILLGSEDNCYLVREWKSDDLLIIESFADQKLISYDLNSNTIIDVPVSPAP